MLPLELRSRRESLGWRAQEHYAPFRPTLFSSTAKDHAPLLGPGAFFKAKPFVPPPTQQQQQSFYRMPRDVNPTRVAAVQRFYDASCATDVGGARLERAGNAVAAMKSVVPRFQPSPGAAVGPGAYSPDRFHGAFAATLARVTPAVAASDKLRAKRAFDASFAIVPCTSAPSSAARARHLPPAAAKQRWPHINRVSPDPGAPRERVELETSSRQLAAALTSRNAYSSPGARELVLASRPMPPPPQPQDASVPFGGSIDASNPLPRP